MSSSMGFLAQFLIALLAGLVEAFHLQGQDSNLFAVEGTIGLTVDSEVSVEIHETLQTVADDLLLLNPVEGQISVHEGLRAIASKMDLKQALKSVDSRGLPHEVQALIKSRSQTNHGGGFDETSMEKARVVLNNLVEKAWVELDDKIIQCKEYQEMNRATFDQVVLDMSRLNEQITDLQRIETESIDKIGRFDAEIRQVHQDFEKEARTYNYVRSKNLEELDHRQKDLDTFQFVMTFTRCADATSLLQSHLNETRICAIKGGHHAMCFSNHAAQTRFNQISRSSKHALSEILAEVDGNKLPPLPDFTPSSRHLIAEILNEVGRESHSFLQAKQAPTGTTTASPAIEVAMRVDSDPVEGKGNPMPKGFVPAPFCCEAYGVSCGPSSGGIMCSPEPPDCGLLHDKLSLMWGDYKDKVDALRFEMSKNEYMWEELKQNFEDQIKVLVNSKVRFSMMLSEARTNLVSDREELVNKIHQKAALEKTFKDYMKLCCERVKWIMFQDMCALIVVRNAVLESSTVCPGEEIIDCEVDNWVSKKCTAACDDTCPDEPRPEEEYECGGWQDVYRKVVVNPPDECGLRCPALARTKKCNQHKCAVDCVMSEWSGWAKCSAECEGGVRSKTRSIITEPRDGGTTCNTVEETEPCNSMSCDRDCSIGSWTSWSPCSVACGGGFQSRARHVLIPTRGFGKCPKENGSQRYAEQKCNTQSCVGDEICVANQDLIIALDGSGSLREDGFNILKSYALNVLERYQSEYFGAAAMKVGVIEFGNGVIMEDGYTVSSAINVHPLSADLNQVKTALEGTVQKKGFTNMAQAFALAETMYTAAGRKGAQSALLVITDGKPSFQFQTNELVEQLDDKGVQRFFVVVSDEEKDLNLMKTWASSPWETNLLHIPGLMPLQADEGVWGQKTLTRFCPLAMSPSILTAKEERGGFMHVKDGGYCGGRGGLLSTDVNDAEGCAFLANGAGAQSFILGSWFRRGYCYAGEMQVDSNQYTAWEGARVAPTCPGDGWTTSMIFDFYALEPISDGGY